MEEERRVGQADRLTPPPPPPPSPTPSPGDSSAPGSITTISTTGLLETEFSDPGEIPIHVEVIPEEEDTDPSKDPAASISRDQSAAPPDGGFGSYSEQAGEETLPAGPGYSPFHHPYAGDEMDSPHALLSEGIYDAYGSSDEYDRRVAGRLMGESIAYMGERLDEDDQYPLEGVAFYSKQDALEGMEGAGGGGGYRSSGSPSHIGQEPQQHHTMEELLEKPHSVSTPNTLGARLPGIEELGYSSNNSQVNSDSSSLPGRVLEEGGRYGSSPPPTSPLPPSQPLDTSHPSPPPPAPTPGTPDIPTDTKALAAEVKATTTTPPEKPKLKGILKKTSSFDLKEADKKSKPNEPLRDSNLPSSREETQIHRGTDTTSTTTTSTSTTHIGKPEVIMSHTDQPEVGELRRRGVASTTAPLDTTTATTTTTTTTTAATTTKITSFPSLSDVMHAKTYDMGALDVRTRLTLLDTVINFLLLTPLTVLFYYATCRLLQLSLLRMLPNLGPWLLLLLGGGIEFAASFCQRPIAARAPKPEVGRPPFADVNLLFLLAAKGYNFVLGFGNVCHMLAMSGLVDLYAGAGLGVSLRVALTSLVALWTLRCGRNVLAPPLYVGVDPDDLGVFASTTMFRVEPDMSIESGADILGTIAVMTSSVHLHWAGIWNCIDAILFPAYFVLSMLMSLILGSATCLLFLLLQQPAGEISRNLERQKRGTLRILFENIFNTSANIGVVLQWRGLWMVYDLMADYFPIYCRSWDIAPLAACVLSFLLLALAHCSSSLLFKGCEVDGELGGGKGVSFTTGYFTEILQGNWDAEPATSSGLTVNNKLSPEKPVAASRAIPSQLVQAGTSEEALATAETTETEQKGKSPNGSTSAASKQKSA